MKRALLALFALASATGACSDRFDVTPGSRVVLTGSASAGARYELRFADAEGLSPIGGIVIHAADDFRADDGSLAQALHVPRFGRKLEVRATAGRLSGLAVTPAPASGFVNVNAHFDIGRRNLSGYSRSVQCAFSPDGGTNALVVSDAPHALMRTDPIPVTPGTDYAVCVEQRREGAKTAVVRAQFRDAAGRLIPTGLPDFKTRHEFHALWAGDGKERWARFKTLPDAATVSFTVTAGALTKFCVKAVPRPSEPPAVRKEGAVRREILIPARCGNEMLFAARELSRWLGAVAGGAWPIYHEKGHCGTAKIVLETTGAEPTAGNAPADGCDVFKTGEDIHIAGVRESGVVSGIFQLLERNTDIVFPRPSFPGEAKFTESRDLVLTNVTFKVRPTWSNRGWGLGYHEPTLLWQRRNYINAGNVGSDGRQSAGIGEYVPVDSLLYEYGRLVSNEKYFADHPEYFAEVNGKRTKYGSWGPQLCYTCEEGRQAFVRELFARLERDLTPAIRKIHLAFADSGALCGCKSCRAPIRLEDGSELPSDDQAYRSTQYFLYVNRIVADVKRRYPNLKVETLGYIAPAIPPKVPLHPDLIVVWCPYPKNDRGDLVNPKDVNVKWAERSRVWPKLCKHLGIYEYWGNAMGFPRAVADSAALNLRLWNRLGVHDRIYSEAPPDDRRDKPEQDGAAGSWDVSAMEFWVLTRLMFDSNLDPETLRRDYLRRTYGPAAPAMTALYETVQGEWRKNTAFSMYNDNAVLTLHRCLRLTGKAKRCRAKLDEAEKLADDPRVAELVRQHRARFEWAYQMIARDIPDDLEIPDAQRSLGRRLPEPTDAVWKRALTLPPLSPLGRPRDVSSNFNAKVSFVHDGAALYARFVCADDEGTRRRRSPAVDGVGYPLGDRAELTIGSAKGGLHRHFAVGRDGTAYAARGYDHRQKAEWSAKVTRTKKGWVAVVCIPFGSIGVEFPAERKFTLLPMRAEGQPGQGRYASWSGRQRHDAKELPKAELVR